MNSIHKINQLYTFICLIVFVFCVTPLNAQESEKPDEESLIQAQQYIQENEPYKAIRIYKDILKKHENDTSVMLNMARAYSMVPEHEKALFWIGRVVEQTNTQLNEALIRFYVDELKLAGRYEIAKIWLEKIKLDLLARQDTMLSNTSVLFEDTAYIKVRSLDFNTAAADFCPVFYKDQLLFYSNRNKSDLKAFNLAGDADADLYSIPLPLVTHANPEIANDLMGYGYYEGSFVFYDNFQKSILSKYLANTNKLITGENKLSGLKLYLAEVDTQENIIDNFNPLPFNIHGYSVAHPSISEDGTVLYFASNIPGGMGGSDIYRSTKEDGIWGPPENLGPEINSAWDEYFPYVYGNQAIFFTSNRPGGIGGFDIYKSGFSGNGTPQPFSNVGAPINSSGDDFCFIVMDDGKSGYFTSNRATTKGKEDVFQFYLEMVSVQDIIEEILQDEGFDNVKIFREKDKSIIVEPLGDNYISDEKTQQQSIVSGQKNNLSVVNENTPTLELKIDPVKYNEIDTNLLADEILPKQNIQLIIRVNGEIIYQAPVEDKLNLSSFLDAKEQVKVAMDKLKTVTTMAHNKEPIVQPEKLNTMFRVQIAASARPITPEQLKNIYRGNREVTEFKEEGWYKYSIGDFDNYFKAAAVKKSCNVQGAFIVAYANKKKQPLMNEIKKSISSVADNRSIENLQLIEKIKITFAFNAFDILPSMQNDLEKIIQIAKQNPDYLIVIKGYADFYGSEVFNLALANERASSIKKYLVEQEIPKQRIEIVALGEHENPKKSFNSVDYQAEKQAKYRKAEVIVYQP